MTKEERDALREKCMKGLECHKDDTGGLCSRCPYFRTKDCDSGLSADTLALLREQPDDQPSQSPEPDEATTGPEPNPLNVEIIGARIRGKYVRIGITPDELEIQIPGVIAPHELPALVDEFNHVLEFFQRNKMVEEETNEHD